MTTKAWVDKLEAALNNLVTLEIVTAVGNVSPSKRDPTTGLRSEGAPDPNAKLLRTRIDLLRGDITTELDPAFVTGEYQELRAFHAAREQQAADIVKRNIEALSAVIALIRSERGRSLGPQG